MSEREETYGDDVELECPACHEAIGIQDYFTDGGLNEGHTIECSDCDAEVEITSVDYDVTVTARVRDRWLDFCDAWERVMRQHLYQLGLPLERRNAGCSAATEPPDGR